MFLINFDAKTHFLNLFIIYIVNNFGVFYYRNLIRDYLLQIDEGKSSVKIKINAKSTSI
jgi:hypothetical protein